MTRLSAGCLLSLLILFFGDAFAAPKHHLPESLMYADKPIDALCLSDDGDISLTSCGIQRESNLIKIATSKAPRDYPNAVGYEYSYKTSGPIRGYVYYQPIAHDHNTDIVFVMSSGGGTGEFSAIKIVTRRKDTLTIKTYQSGDRCNNGISHVKKNGNEITYRVKITPFDLLLIAKENPQHLKAYDDLVACAVCCAGTALESRSLHGNELTGKIIYVDLSHYVLDQGGYGNELPYQACFNKLISRYKLKHQSMIFTFSELKHFVHEFNQTCFSLKASVL